MTDGSADVMFGGKQFVPLDEDTGEVRSYYQYCGNCPSGGCGKSWGRIKSKLWSYVGPDEVLNTIVGHLQNSPYHNMSLDDATNVVNEKVDQDPSVIAIHEETFEMRQTMRDWVESQAAVKAAKKDSGNAMVRVSHASNMLFTGSDSCGWDDASSSSKGGPPMTAMLKEAVDYVMRRQNWDQGGDQSAPSDEPDVLDVVNCLTGGGCDTLPNGAKLELKRKMGDASGQALATKRANTKITFDLDELKTMGHALIRGKSAARTLATEAETLANTAWTMANNLRDTERLIGDCQTDMVKVMQSVLARK